MSAVFGTIEAGLRYYQETLRNDLSRDALLEEMVGVHEAAGKTSIDYKRRGGESGSAPTAGHGLIHRQGPGFRERFDDQTEVKRLGWQYYPCVRTEVLGRIMMQLDQFNNTL